MMNIQYARQIDEITSDELRPDLYYQNERNPTNPERKWPLVIGIVEIISGFITAMLGTLEIFIVPMMEDIHEPNAHILTYKNCYGAALFAGFMLILTGSTAIRASISKRATTVFRFYNLTVLTVIIYAGITVYLITAYALGWTTQDNFPAGSHMHEVHMMATLSTVLGLMFVTSAVVKYYDLVFCGEMQLGMKWLRCLCCCCCQRRHETGRYSPIISSRISTGGLPI